MVTYIYRMTPYMFQEITYISLCGCKKPFALSLNEEKKNNRYLKNLITKSTFANENISKVNLIQCYSAFFYSNFDD